MFIVRWCLVCLYRVGLLRSVFV